MKDHPMSDCSTYPLRKIQDLEARLQRVTIERDLLAAQVDRMKMAGNKNNSFWDDYMRDLT